MAKEKVTSIARQEANRANSKSSTGPKSAEGKQRSSLNALRHGLTAHIVVLPTEDAALFEAFVAKCHEMFLPETDQETELVQTLANTRWRLNRCGALEANLFAMAHEQHAPTGDVETGLAAAACFQESADTFLKLSLYEQRLMRLYQTTKKELLTVQAARRTAADSESYQAGIIGDLHIDHDRPFNPADFGFVSTNADLHKFNRRSDALRGELSEKIPPGAMPSEGKNQ